MWAPGGHTFVIPTRYVIRSVLGSGAYGTVCDAVDRDSGNLVAIKKFNGCFDRLDVAIRTVRELNTMATLRYHPKVCHLLDIMIPPHDADSRGGDLYLAMELLDSDLFALYDPDEYGQSDGGSLSQQIIRYIAKQIVQGVSAMHAAGILHRDLKTPNILIIKDSAKVRVADFGFAREEGDASTIYVVTRPYRAPEVALGIELAQASPGEFAAPTAPVVGGHVDMWSVGCIVAELIRQGRLLFNGQSNKELLDATFELLGRPTEEALGALPQGLAQWFRSLDLPTDLGTIETLHEALQAPSDATAEDLEIHRLAVDFIKRCLAFDPATRITAADALQHPYLNDGAVSDEEPFEESSNPPRPLDPGHELRTISDCRAAVQTILDFLRSHPSARGTLPRTADTTSDAPMC